MAVSAVTPIAHNRLHLKAVQTDPSDTIDQWNPSPPWSETTQKVPDIVQQELSPYLARTPPTPTSAPLPQAASNGLAFSFDWMPEQFVPIMDPSQNHVNTMAGISNDATSPGILSTMPSMPVHVAHWSYTDHKFHHLDAADRPTDEETKGKYNCEQTNLFEFFNKCIPFQQKVGSSGDLTNY